MQKLGNRIEILNGSIMENTNEVKSLRTKFADIECKFQKCENMFKKQCKENKEENSIGAQILVEVQELKTY